MQPKIIYKDRLYINGITGNGADTGKVWDDFDNEFKAAPFNKEDNNGYEVRFYNGVKSVDLENNIHVGFSVGSNDDTYGFSTIELPATEYVIFEVAVANGYDSENEAVNNWLASNSNKYRQSELDGKLFVIECYNEKFKGGNKPDSIVEVWIPIIKQ